MIRGIIVDCFGVLQVDSSHKFFSEYVQDFERLQPQLLELNRAFDYGLISEEDHYQAVCELTGLDYNLVAQKLHGTDVLNEPVLNWLQQLRKTYRLAMLSNIGRGGMDKYITRDERDKWFDVVVLSSDVMMTKPDPNIYKLTAERLGLDVSECVMVDDNPENIAGADAAGMQGIVYKTLDQMQRDLAALGVKADA